MNLKLYLSSVDKIQRYSPIYKEISKEDTLLDVGGGDGTIFYFNKGNDITVLDINETELSKSKKLGLKTITASGSKIPFEDNSFDVVTSIASLEHVPPSERIPYLKELKRVAKKKVLIYFPTGTIGEKYDRKLLKFRKLLHKKDPWTEEHLTNGLPSIDLIQEVFSSYNIKKIQNAYLWYLIMILQTIPLLNKFLPGIIYFILKPLDRLKPHIGVFVKCNL
jgi:ubiquinone/menaquinone biosynthesis C-methylase UbiE